MPEEINHPTIGVNGSRAKSRRTFKMGGNAVNRPQAADDFPTIRARLEELRRERERVERAKKALASDPVPVRVIRGGQIAISVRRSSSGAG